MRCGLLFYYDSRSADLRIIGPVQVAQRRSVDGGFEGIDYNQRTREQEQALEHIRQMGGDLTKWPILPEGYVQGLNVVEYDYNQERTGEVFDEWEIRELNPHDLEALVAGKI